MKSKPVVMDHFSMVHTAFQINFVFTIKPYFSGTKG